MEKTAKRIGIAVIAVLLVALLCVGIALALPQAETPLASSDSGSGAELATANVVKVGDDTYDLDTYDGAMAYYNYLTGTLGYYGITNQTQLEDWARDGVEGNLATSLQGKAALKPYDDNRNKITYEFGGGTTTTNFDGFADDSNTVDVSSYKKYTETLMVNCKDWGKPEIFRAAFDGCGADVVLYPPMPDETPNTGTSCEMTNAQVNTSLGQGSSLTLLTNREGYNAMFTGAFGVAAIGARLANFNFRYKEEQLCYFANYKDKGSYTGGLFGAMINCTVNNCSLDIPDGATIYGKKRTNDPGSIFGWKPNAKSQSMGTLSFGGIAGYSYGTSFTNMNVSVDGTLNMHITGWGTTYTGGVPNGFIGGIVGVSQGVTMHNIYVSGNGGITADPQEPFWGGDYVKFSRVGALVGMDFSSGNINDINNTIKWTGCPTGSSSISGIITSYSGTTNYELSQVDKGNNNSQWITKKGSLFGSVAAADVSAVYYTTANAPENIGSINKITPSKITATSDKTSGVTVGFVNNAYPVKDRTSDDQEYIVYDLGDFNDLDVTYTVPDAVAGEIVWAYTVNDGAEQTLYDKQDKGQPSYTIKHKFTTAQDTVYKFTTGTRVTFEVLGKNDVSLSNEEYAGEGKNVVDSKQFDNKRFDVPKLRVVDMKGNNFLGGDNNVLHFNNDVSTGTAVWSIWKGNNSNVDGATAAGAGDYTYRFRTNTTEDLFYFINVNGNERVIAYKSDNDPDVSRVYSYHIDPKEVEVSVEGSEFTYDTNPQKPNFTWEPVAGDASVPTLNISYKNAEGGALAEAQVTEAGSYTATVSQFASNANYKITNLDALQTVSFTILPRKLTLDFTADDSRPYNGAPQFPDVTVGNLPANVNPDMAVNKYYFKGSDPGTASDDIVASTIINVGDYMLRVAPANGNYVIDTEKVTGTSGSVTETSAWKMFSITKAELKFDGTEDDNYTFVYGPEAYTLGELNSAIGGDKDYLFQPADSTNENPVDQNLGSGVDLKIVSGPSPDSIWYAGQYQVTVTYEETDNFLACTATLNVTVQQRELTLTLNTPETDTFEYGNKPVFEYDSTTTGTGAVPEDLITFGIVYYRNDGDDVIKPENEITDLQGADPKAVGSYIASFEPISSSVLGDDILVNYYISKGSDNTFVYEITPATLTVTFDGDLSTIPYDGEEHSPATISNVDGIIPDEQGDYNKDTLKVFYVNETGDSASSARNAGTYTLAVAPEANSEQFMTNYVIGGDPTTFTIERAPLTLQLLDVTMDYASATGQAIPYGEGVTHNFVEGTQIFDGDDVQEDPNKWLLQIYTLNENDGSELTINGIGTYLFSIRLNPTNSNAGNYELTLTDSEEGAKYPNAPEGVGTLTIEGTAVFHGIRGTSDSGFAVMEEPTNTDPFTYNIDVTYRGEDIKFSFFTRTTAGSLEGLSFDEFSVAGAVESGLDEATGYPYVVVRNVGKYTATWTLAAQSQDIFFFPNEDGSTSDQNSLTVTINVGKLDAEIVPNDVSVVYGGTIEYNGFSVVGDEDGTKEAALTADNVQVEYTSTTASTANVDTYDGAVTITGVTFEGTLGDNYNITYTGSAALTISPRPVTVTLEMTSNTVTYGDDLPTVKSVSGENFVGNDKDAMAELIGEQLVYDHNAGVDKVPTLKTGAIGNYTVTLADGTGKITITAKQISGVRVAAGKMPYGGSEKNITPVKDGEYFTVNPGFLEEDLDKLALAFTYPGDGLSALEPGDHAGVLQLTITNEEMKGNYNITGYAANGTLTVEAMIINEANVVVTLDKYTYDGGKIGYTIQISGVTVVAGDHLDISLTKDGSAVNEIKDAGEYVFAIKGDDTFYQGNVNITVTVNKADISDIDFGLDKTSATYTGSEIQVSANTDNIAVSLAVTQEGKEAQLINAGTYTVTVTPTDPNYTGSKEFTFIINKAPHKAPVEDDLKIEVTWNSVTVTHDEFIVELSKDGNDPWVDTTMEGYEANTSYTLHVRFQEDDNHSASSNTIMISGKTAERTAVKFEIADVEEHYNRAVLTITFEEAFSGKVQFSIDGGKNWSDLTVQDGKYVASGLAESAEYTLQVKIPAGDDYLESEVKSVKVKTGIDPAKYTETLAMFGETFSAGDLVNYETLKEQFNGLTEADKAGVDAAKFETITAARDAFVASVNSDIEDIQNVAAKTAGRAVAAAAAAVTAAAIALFIAKRKFI